MERRKFLSKVATISAIGLTGCVNQEQENNDSLVDDPDNSNSNSNSNSNNGGGNNQSTNQTAMNNSTSKYDIPENATVENFTQERRVWIKEEQLVREFEGSNREKVEVQSLLKNVGNKTLKALEVKVIFKDENYRPIDNSFLIKDLEPGEEKYFNITFNGFAQTAQRIKHYTFNINPCELPCNPSNSTPDAYFENEIDY